MAWLRLIAPALAIWTLAGCIRDNASHCGNRRGHRSCEELGDATPVCNVCVSDNDGCVAGPIADPQCRFVEETAGASTDDGAGGRTSSTSGDGVSTEPTSSSGSASGNEASDGDASGSSGGPADPCGNGSIDDGEECDGAMVPESCASLGFGGGTLTCGMDCYYDTRSCDTPPACNNGILEPGEQCDGTMIGSATCPMGQVGPPSCTAMCTIDLEPCCTPRGGECVSVVDDACCPTTTCMLDGTCG